jgi:glycosyltransferase involved in cell wall biosynthesis
MKLTLIITTYNWPESLFLVLQSVKRQTILPFEVIIADDGSNDATKNLIYKCSKNSSINIIHSWQEDVGFRAALSRNKAILKSSGDYIVLIDGDMILHPKFIQDHIKVAERGFFVQGSRVLLSENLTKKTLSVKNYNFSFFSLGIKNRKNALHSNVFNKLFSRKRNNLNSIRSCNMGFFLKDCANINGFDNNFEGWGREDSEFAIRMMNAGINRKNVRFAAIQFHLWHNENSRLSLKHNNDILENTINNNIKWCQNGINSIE